MNKLELITRITNLNLPQKSYIIVGSGGLCARNIRESRDIDIVVLPELFTVLEKNGWESDPLYRQKWGRERLKRENIEIHQDMFLEKTQSFVNVPELIAQAEIIENIPFLPLHLLRMFKSDTGQEKDINDIALIDAFICSH